MITLAFAILTLLVAYLAATAEDIGIAMLMTAFALLLCITTLWSFFA